MASDSPRPRARVTPVQLVTALLLFVVFSVMGGFLVAGLALPVATVAGSATKGTASLFEELPQELSQTKLPQSSSIYDRTGTHLLATFYNQNRVVVPLDRISPWIQKAVVAVEDKRFWQHHGVDGEGLVRAAYVNLTSANSPGGSTLTQQLVKNTLLQNAIQADDFEAQQAATEVSVTRKIKEWRLALAFEENVDREYGTHCTTAPEVDCGKKQILEQYLNIAQFGLNIYGVESAAQFYFGKPAAELDALQAATIAGITQNPSKWDPVRYPEQAKQRRDVVLGVMYEQDMLTRAQYDELRATTVEDTLDLHRPKFSCSASVDAPFFCDYVTKVIKFDDVFNRAGEESGTDLLYRGGLKIITTLDLHKQKIANQELRKSLPPKDKSGFAMAMVALEPKTGQVLVMAQNRDFDPTAKEAGSTAINYAVDRKWGGSRGFSPGSTFKPIILSQWLNSNHSLSQVVTGYQRKYEPSSWQASCLGDKPYTGEPWSPANVDGVGGYSMSVLKATQNSVNTAYAAIANQLDLCSVRDMAENLGFHRADGAEFEVVPSVVLGTQNASPLTMASVAQTFANGGVHCDPIAILKIKDAQGNEYPVPPKNCAQVISKDIATGVTYAMQQVIKAGSGVSAQLKGNRPAAGKTGTSQLNAHTWFMGFTPQLVATVWLGNPNRDQPGHNIRLNGKFYPYLYGSSVSAPTWKRFMDRALGNAEMKGFDEPSDAILYGARIDVPDVVGLPEKEAQAAISAAGFQFKASIRYTTNSPYPAGSVVAQYPSAGYQMRSGSYVTYYLPTSSLPSWWYNWPSDWDPNVPPAGYWGSTWPPASWADNPPSGWNPTPSDPPADNSGTNNGNGRGNGGGN